MLGGKRILFPKAGKFGSLRFYLLMSGKKRVIVVVNKWWECDPVMNVLLNANALPKDFPKWPTTLHQPHRRPGVPLAYNPNPQPRAVFTLANCAVEIWCISDLLEDCPDPSAMQSSSQLKHERLPSIFQGTAAALVIAVGTAAFPGPVSENGSVVVGTNVFMHDGNADHREPVSQWHDGPFDRLLPSALESARFQALTQFDPGVGGYFLPVPQNPAWRARILAHHDHVALGTINITNPANYDETDRATQEAFFHQYPVWMARSQETTHGVIRAATDAPFLFISAIVNRVGAFADEVAPRPYAQQTAAASNAGVVLAWMLPKIDANV